LKGVVSKDESGEVEEMEQELDGTGHVQRRSALYARQVQQWSDTFLKAEIYFCFNHPRDLSVGLRSQKGMRFKIFWIPQHLREEILVNGSNQLAAINPIGAVIRLNK
jgi:hypothetical protein